LPIVLLVVYSFNGGRLVTVWAGFSTRWYVALLHDRQMLEAAFITLRLGVISATIATVLGTLAAIGLVRGGLFGGRLLFRLGAAGRFVDIGAARGLRVRYGADRNNVTWSARAIDLDSDGYLDLLAASGELAAADFIGNGPDLQTLWLRGGPDGAGDSVLGPLQGSGELNGFDIGPGVQTIASLATRPFVRRYPVVSTAHPDALTDPDLAPPGAP